MKRIIVIVLALVALLILSVVAQPFRIVTAPIEDVVIWADKSFPPEYFVDVVSGEPTSCYKYLFYYVKRLGSRIKVLVFNLEMTRAGCYQEYKYVEHTIPLGSCFITGVNYTVEVNHVTETFVPPIL